MSNEKIISDLEWIFSALTKGIVIENDDSIIKAIPEAINKLEVIKTDEDTAMDMLRVENAELIQRNLQLEKDLAKESAYNYALVTVIRNNYPT